MRGAILLLALVYLVLLALVAGAVVQSATLQLRMAGNEHFAAQATAHARAVATEISGHVLNFDPAVPVGAARCVAVDPARACASGGLVALPAALAAAVLDYRVVRRAPVVLTTVPLVGAELSAPGAPFALYEVHVRAGAANASAQVVRGVLLGLPVAGDPAEPAAAHAGELYGVYWRFPATDPL
ncbi:MAG: hypothetical protein HKN19_02820 [Halioglobus sp.]|nr:hypothetical protein [Halioglobus sp.]